MKYITLQLSVLVIVAALFVGGLFLIYKTDKPKEETKFETIQCQHEWKMINEKMVVTEDPKKPAKLIPIDVCWKCGEIRLHREELKQ